MNDAEMNARRALDFSLKNAKQEIFWIDAGQTQHGPLGKEIQLEYQLISSDPKLQEISEKTGLSTTSILKIIAIADVRKSYIFRCTSVGGVSGNYGQKCAPDHE